MTPTSFHISIEDILVVDGDVVFYMGLNQRYNDKKVIPKWITNKKSAATVSKSGVIIAKKADTAVITATYRAKKAKISVKVVTPKQSIRLYGKTVKVNSGKMSLTKGQREQLTVKLFTKLQPGSLRVYDNGDRLPHCRSRV